MPVCSSSLEVGLVGHCILGKGAGGSPARATPMAPCAPAPLTQVPGDEQVGMSPIPGSLPLSKSGNHRVGWARSLVFFKKWGWVEGVNERRGAPSPNSLMGLGVSAATEPDQVSKHLPSPGTWRLKVGEQGGEEAGAAGLARWGAWEESCPSSGQLGVGTWGAVNGVCGGL